MLSLNFMSMSRARRAFRDKIAVAAGGDLGQKAQPIADAKICALIHNNSTKRVTRFELVTFTLATCRPSTANRGNDNDLAEPPTSTRSACAAVATPKAEKRDDLEAESDPRLMAIVTGWDYITEAGKIDVLNAYERAAKGV